MHLPRGVLHALAATLSFTNCVFAKAWDYEPQYNEAGTTDALSWGVHGKVWSKDHRHIQGWTLHGGEGGFRPELHSDRIILTPPYPGGQRGGVWSEQVEQDDEWETEFKFRASGPEKGSGLFQMWYAGNPHEAVKLASLYTVGKFDGLLLAIGMYGGRGSVRAFLNDNSISFKDHHHVDSLAFASCDLDYRNTGHFIKVKVRQTDWTFEVEVDDRHCFQTHKIHLPHGYHFGLTAASAETPDSFEVSSFITHKLVNGQRVPHEGHDEKNMHGGHEKWVSEVQEHLHHTGEQQHMDSSHNDRKPHSYSADDRGWYWTNEQEEVKDQPADHYKSEADRFADLHDRLTLLSHQLALLFNDLTTFKKETEDRHEALLHYLKPLYDYAEYSKHQVETLKEDIHAVRRDIEDHSPRGHLEIMKHHVQGVHDSYLDLAQEMHKSHPRMRFLLFVVCAFQVLLLGSYMIYRRRMNSQPKKYL